MGKLIKSLCAVFFILLANLLRKGRFIYLIISVLLLMSLVAGIFIGNSFSRRYLPCEELSILNSEPVGNYIGISFNYQPSISSDGKYVTFGAVELEINKIKDVDVKLYDNKLKKYLDLPGLNGKGWDLAPSISGDGRFIAFQSNRKGSASWDIYLYDTRDKKLLALPKLNSIFPDFAPSISPDGRYITFNSVRSLIPKVYIYSVDEQKVSPLFEE